MVTRSTKAAKAALVPAIVSQDATSLNRVDVIARLANANAKERLLLLTALHIGDIAAIGGKVAGMAASVNEALNIKLCEKHGNDWASIAKALPADLCEADKTRRKAINASLEGIRETVKANAAGDAQKAAETIRRVKEWGLGIRQSKSKPKSNEKQALGKWALSWDVFPSAYRRIMKDDMEDMPPAKAEAMLAVADAMAAFFQACNINPRAVIDCSGKQGWNH